jgi:hypothetical protein
MDVSVNSAVAATPAAATALSSRDATTPAAAALSRAASASAAACTSRVMAATAAAASASRAVATAAAVASSRATVAAVSGSCTGGGGVALEVGASAHVVEPSVEAGIGEVVAADSARPPADLGAGGEETVVAEVEGRVRPCMKHHTRDGETGRGPSVEGNGAISDGVVTRTLATISFPLGVDGE